MAGLSPAYVQEQPGLSSTSITVDIYGHWIPGEGRAELEAALAGGAEPQHLLEEKSFPFPYRSREKVQKCKTNTKGSDKNHK